MKKLTELWARLAVYDEEWQHLLAANKDMANEAVVCDDDVFVLTPWNDDDAILGKAVRAEVTRQLDATQLNLVRRADELREGCYSAATDAATLYDVIACELGAERSDVDGLRGAQE